MSKGYSTVLLVDDHPVARIGMRRLLEQRGIRVMAEADTGEQACRQFEACRPDVVLMDLHMPGMGGLEAVRRIRARDETARIMIFTMAQSPALFAQAVALGVKGYLTKRAAGDEFVEAVCRVADNKHYYDSELGAGLLQQQSGEQERSLAPLTPREFEVFRLLAEGHTVSDISGILSISPKTAGVHHTRIMHKLDIRSPVQLVRLAYQNGVIPL